MFFLYSLLRLLRPSSTTDIGNVLLKMGAVSPRDLELAAKKQQEMEQRAKLGEILISMGHISREDLANALHAQSLMRRGKKADAILGIIEHRVEGIRIQLLGTK